MIFWDSSAIVPLLVKEEETDYCLNTLSKEGFIVNPIEDENKQNKSDQ